MGTSGSNKECELVKKARQLISSEKDIKILDHYISQIKLVLEIAEERKATMEDTIAETKGH